MPTAVANLAGRDAHGPDGDGPPMVTSTSKANLFARHPQAKSTASKGMPKPSGAAGGMPGMSHGGMRARSPQVPKGMPSGMKGMPKPSGGLPAPKPTGGMAGMPGMGGMRKRHPQGIPKNLPSGFKLPSGMPGMPAPTGAPAMPAKGSGGHSHGGA